MILREDQKLPIDYWQNWILIGGRGSGKTTAACMGIEQLIKTNRYKKIGFIGTTLFDSKTLMVEENFLKYITGYVYQRSNRKIIVNNTIIYLFGGDKYNSLRG